MTTQELIENGILDAHGLLDEDERIRFERAFDGAPPHVQALVRREQARNARLDRLLPQVEPPMGLRAAILELYREEMAERVLADIAGDTSPRRATLELIPSSKVSPLWRAFAVGSIAAAVVFGVAMLQMRSQFTDLQHTLAENRLLDEISQTFGGRFVQDTLFDVRTRRVSFHAPDDGSHTAQASMWHNPDWDTARLFCLKLTVDNGRQYRLTLIDDSGAEVRTLRRFNASGGLDTESVTIDLRELTEGGLRLAIVPDGPLGEVAPVLVSLPGSASSL